MSHYMLMCCCCANALDFFTDKARAEAALAEIHRDEPESDVVLVEYDDDGALVR